ncbi:MAG: transferrin-binding protein-like solute binding protein [Pseudomonadota bacterium]
MRAIFCGIGLLSLAACGGGGGTTASLSTSGYAEPGSQIFVNYESRPRPFQLITSRNNAPDFTTADVSLEVSGTTELTFVVDGVTYVVAVNGSRYEGSNGNVDARFYPEQLSYDDLEYGWLLLFNTVTGERTAGYVHWGFDTDPNEINALNGSVTYTGQVRFDAYSSTSGELGGGSIQLNADFDTDIINGSMILEDINGVADDLGGIPNATVTINPTMMDGNGFETTITTLITGPNPNGVTVDPGTLNGTFFGPNGVRVGGTFAAGAGSTLDPNLVVQGGFIAAQ